MRGGIQCDSKRNRPLTSLRLVPLLYLSAGGYLCQAFYVDSKG